MVSDPSLLYRLRDGVYAADLLVVAVAELDLFTWVRDHPGSDARTISDALELRDHPLDVLLTYLVALGLLERDGDRLSTTPLAVEHLTGGSPYDLRPYYASIKERPGCAALLSVLKTGEPAAWASASGGDDWESRLDDPGFAGSITAAMDARGRYLGPALATALSHLPFTRALDIGGSSGVYLAELLAVQPGTSGAVLERPPVDRAARTLISARGMADRVEVITGDLFHEAFPEGFDLHLYSHVLHDWDGARVRGLIEKSYRSLPPGGWFVDHDVHVNEDKTGPLAAAEYSVFLMHATPGKCWSTGELDEMLTEAGFADVEVRDTVGHRSVVIAHRP